MDTFCFIETQFFFYMFFYLKHSSEDRGFSCQYTYSHLEEERDRYDRIIFFFINVIQIYLLEKDQAIVAV